ncbi:MAG: radical SAM protein [Syntrophobacteraceae bacterium]|nr:radical SAM protein [Syntrophobacteraceae bacterium]
MNIALVFPPFYFEPMYNLPPLGLINLATALISTPHTVKIFDFPLDIRRKSLAMDKNIYTRCARHILDFSPDVAGFSVQCTTYPPAVNISRELKRLAPQLKIVFGGPNVSSIDELTLSRFPFIDAIVRGEGEIAFPELIGAFEGRISPGSVDGITFRASERIFRNPDRQLIENLDSLPAADYSFAPPFSEYRDVCGIGRSIAILEVGRGCPHRCVYCSQSVMWKRRARTFSTAKIIAEMKNLAQNFGAECFLLAFDQFTAKRSFAEKFCHGLIDAGLDHLPWYCISRLDTVDKDLLTLMRRAGCETMCYGIDSGSKKTLAFIHKDIDRDILFDRVRRTTEAGIVPTLSFVIGFPREERQDLEETLELTLRSAATGNTNVLVQMATILPGTELYKNYRHLLVREVDTYFSLGIEFDRGARLASDDRLIDSDPEIFSSFYNLPCPAGAFEQLNETASYFTVIAALYPRSFLLLSGKLGIPVTELFFDFLDSVAQREAKATGLASSPAIAKPGASKAGARRLSPRACLAHFEAFAGERLSGSEEVVREFLAELIRYETRLFRAGENGLAPSPFTIDPAGIHRDKPLRSTKVSIERFTYDIPSLILRFVCGQLPDTCPKRPVFLAFSRAPDATKVKEINEFGVDFLGLCDGKRSLGDIADQLYQKYGVQITRGEFAAECAQAAETLFGLELLAQGESPKS